jgi:hypothetical protein
VQCYRAVSIEDTSASIYQYFPEEECAGGQQTGKYIFPMLVANVENALDKHNSL